MDRCWGARADGGCDEPDGLAGRCCRRGVYRLRGDVTLGRRLVGCRRRAAGTASPGPRGRRPGPPGRRYSSPPSSWNGTSTTRCSRAPQRSAALCTVLHRPRGGTERRPALRLAVPPSCGRASRHTAARPGGGQAPGRGGSPRGPDGRDLRALPRPLPTADARWSRLPRLPRSWRTRLRRRGHRGAPNRWAGSTDGVPSRREG